MVIERAGLLALAVMAAIGALGGGVWWYGESRFVAGARAEAERQAAHIRELNDMILTLNDAATDAYAEASAARSRLVAEAKSMVGSVPRAVSAQCDLPDSARLSLSKIGGP